MGDFKKKTLKIEALERRLMLDAAAPIATTAMLSIAEDASNGDSLGTVVASDPDGETINYTVTGGTGFGIFDINLTTGEVTVIDDSVLDFETTPSYTLDLNIQDVDGTFTPTTAHSITINLTNVDEAPVQALNTGMTITESDTATTITAAMLDHDDVDTADGAIVYTIGTVPANGTLRLSGSVLSNGQTFTQADINGGLVTYDHDGSESASESFSFTVSDGTTPLAADNFTISVTNVDDAPTTGNNTGVTVNEGDTATTITSAMLSTNDVDTANGALVYTVNTTVANGDLRLSGTILNNGDTFTQAQINSGLVTYDHDGSNTTTDSFNFTVTDGSTPLAAANFSITVTPVDDAPVAGNNTGVTITESDTGTVITNVMLSTTDNDTLPVNIVYTVASVPGTGTLRVSGTPLSNGQTFTQADIDAGNVTYDHAGDENATESFTYTVTDGSTPLVADTFTINVTNVDDAPTTGNNTGVTVNEGDTATTITSAMLSTNDVDTANGALVYTVNTTVVNGTLRLSGTPLSNGQTFTQADINAGNVTYDHDGSNTTTDSFNFTVTDGSTPLAAANFSITVTPIDDAPVAGNNTGVTIAENDTGTVITNVMLSTTDSDTAAASLVYTVTSVPGNGTLRLSGTPLSNGQTFTQADIDAGNVTYDHDGAESAAESFTYTVTDGTTPLVADTFNITVTPVDDAPTLVNNSGVTVAEGAAGTTITTAMLDHDDVDTANGSLVYTVNTTVANGTLRLSGTPLNNGDTFTQADIDAGNVTYDHDGSNTTTDVFNFTITDGTTPLAADNFNLTITPIDDAPFAVNNTGVTITENDTGTVITAAMLDTDDNDTPDNQITYTLASVPGTGTLRLSGAALLAGDTFTQADINAGNVTYDHAGDENATETFDFDVADLTTALPTATFTITVTPVNDIPVSVASAMTITEDNNNTVDVIDLAELGVTDPDNTDAEITYTVTSLPINGILTINGAAAMIGDTFTQQDIIDGDIAYDHDGLENLADSFDYTFEDLASGAIAGTFNITVTPDNDRPTLVTAGTVTIDETGPGSSYTLTTLDLFATDPDNLDSEIRWVMNIMPLHAEVQLNGTTLTKYQEFTQQDVIDGNVTIISNGTEAIGGTDFIQFQLRDGEGPQTFPQLDINITNNENNGPVWDANEIALANNMRYDAVNDKFYQYVAASVDWNTAQTLAAAATLNGVNGHLATSTSAAENDFLRTFVQADSWIGATDAAVEGTWEWVEGPEAGTAFWQGNGAGIALGGNYENWQGADPNDGGNASGLVYRHWGAWRDQALTANAAYIIEWDGQEVLESYTAIDVAHNDPDAGDLNNGDVIGTVYAHDEENDTLNYSIIAGNATGLFAIDNNGVITIADDTTLDATVQDTYVITVRATDVSGSGLTNDQVFTIQFNEAPEAPVNNGHTATEGATTTITTADLNVTDNNTAATDVTFNIDSAPANGVLALSTAPGVSITSFTLDDLQNNRVTYTHDGSETPFADSFDFHVTDNTTTFPVDTFAIAIDPVNDAVDITNLSEDPTVASVLAANPTLQYNSATGNFYSYVTTAETFTDAQTAAAAFLVEGVAGHLATIQSQAEQDFVYNIVTGGAGSVWLGGSDAASEGDWFWSEDPNAPTQFSTGATAFGVAYENWDAGQPNNVGGIQDYAAMNGDGTWGDFADAAPRNYVIEWDGDAVLAGGGLFTDSTAIDAIPDQVLRIDASDMDGDGDRTDQPANGTGVTNLEDTAGATDEDGSVNGDAPAYADNAFSSGASGIRFDGVDDGIALGGGNEVNTGNFDEKSFAVSFQTGASTAGHQVIYEQGGTGRGYQFSIVDGNLYAYVWNVNEWTPGDQHKSIDLGVVGTNTEYYVVAVQNSNGPDTWSASVNGGPFTTLTDVDFQRSHADPGGIGRVNSSSLHPVTNAAAGTALFQGVFGEIRSWNHALTSAEVTIVEDYMESKWVAGVGGGALEIDINEIDPAGTLLVDAEADNPEDVLGETLIWTIEAGNTDGIFGIDAATGEITIADTTNLDFETTASYTLTVRATDSDFDGLGAEFDESTVTINITDNNEAPTVDLNTGATINEGDTLTITTAMLTGSDQDASDTDADITYTASNITTNGQLELTSAPGVAITSFTQADLAGGLVVFVHDGGETTAASFDFTLADGGEDGVVAPTGTFNIAVTPVNDAPVIINNTGGAVIADIDFSTATLNNVAAQSSGTTTIQDGGDTLFLSGNEWQSVNLPITINADTVIRFDFRSTSEGEIHGFAFSNDLSYNGAVDEAFQIFGDDPNAAFNQDFFDYNIADGWKTYQIPIGTYFTGSFTELFFIADDDGSAAATSYFRNVEIIDTGGTVLNVTEGSSLTITNAMINEDDPDDDGVELTYTASNITNGQLELTTGPGTPITIFTQDDIDNNRVIFVHDGTQTSLASFDLELADGGEDSVGTDTTTVEIVVTNINDVPVIANDTITVTEDGSQTIDLNTLIADEEGINYATDVALSVPGNGTAVLDTATGIVTYTPDPDYFGADSFTFTVDDGTGPQTGTISVTVTPVNDTPIQATNTGVTITENDTGTVITTAMLNATDVDNTNTDLVYTLSSVPANGTLLLNGTPLGATDTFTQADINAGLLRYDHDGSESASESFGFSVSDGAITLGADSFVITVTPVDDAPTQPTNTGVTITENDTATTITNAMLAAADDDNAPGDLTYTVTSIPGNGILRLSGTPLGNGDTFTQADINAGNVTYDHDGAESAAESFTFTLDDGNTTLLADTFDITVTPVNDAPTQPTNTGVTITENDTATTITSAMLAAADDDNAPGDLVYTLSSVPANGTLRLNGTPLGATDSFTQADINAGNVTYDHDGAESASESFGFTLSDGAIALGADTFAITVTPVNDLPIPVNNGVTLNEAATVTVDNTMLSASDAETADPSLLYTVSDVPSHGLLRLNGTPLNNGDSFTQDDIDNSRITYVHDGTENFADDFEFTIDDGTGGVTVADTFDFTITPVNDAPTVNVPVVVDPSENDPLGTTITTMSATNPEDFRGETIAWSIQSGNADGVFGIDPTTGEITIVDTTNLDFETTTSYTLVVRATDSNLDGPAALFDEQNVVINIIDFNESPAILDTNVTQTMAEGATLFIDNTMLSGSDEDGTDTPDQIFYTASNITNGQLELTSGPGTAITTFTQEDINNNLVVFIHDSTDTLTAGFDFSLADGGENGSTPAVGTFNITVTPVNDLPVQNTNTGTTLAEGATATIDSTMLAANDDETADSALLYTLTTLPTHGSILLNGTALNVSDTFTQDDIDMGRIAYEHDGTENFADSFGFTLGDGTDTLAADSFALTITPVDDPLQLTTNTPLTIVEGAAGGVIDASILTVTDPDTPIGLVTYTVTSLPSEGVLYINGTPATLGINDSFTQADVNGGLVTYDHNGGELPTDSFTFDATDGTSTIGPETLNISVTPVDDAPTQPVNTGVTIAENDTATVITNTMLAAADVDTNPSDLTYTITTVPDNGTVLLNGVALGNGGTFTQDDIDNGRVTYDHDGAEDAVESFAFTLGDATTSLGGDTFTINVIPVDDPLTLSTNTGFTAAEGSAGNVITQAMLEVTDPDTPIGAVTYTITSLPVNGGTVRLSGTALGIGDTFTQADINGGLVTYDHDGSEVLSDSFTFNARDISTTLPDATLNITITPVDDAPVQVTNTTQIVSRGFPTPLQLDNLNYSDVDSPASDITFTVQGAGATRGFLELSSNPNVPITSFTLEQLQNEEVFYRHDGTGGGTEFDSFDFRVADLTTNLPPETFNVQIQDNNPPDIIPAVLDIDENANNGAVVGTLTFTDDPAQTPEFTILSGNIDNIFDIDLNTGQITVVDNTLLDFETSNQFYDLVIEMRDPFNLTDIETIRININDVNDPPTDILLSNTVFQEELGNGFAIGKLTTVDMDDTIHSYQVISSPEGATGRPMFSVSGSNLVVNDWIDAERLFPNLDMTITVRTFDGLNFFDKDFTLTVEDAPEDDVSSEDAEINTSTFVNTLFRDDTSRALFAAEELDTIESASRILDEDVFVNGSEAIGFSVLAGEGQILKANIDDTMQDMSLEEAGPRDPEPADVLLGDSNAFVNFVQEERTQVSRDFSLEGRDAAFTTLKQALEFLQQTDQDTPEQFVAQEGAAPDEREHNLPQNTIDEQFQDVVSYAERRSAALKEALLGESGKQG